MRVVGGALRGRRLHGPPSDVRPTSDRVRESLFAILGALEGRRVLDLCAGTGALGIEALSRGATDATFVDRSSRSLAVLRRNLADLDLVDRSTVVRSEVARCLRRWSSGGEAGPFDLVFFDPPYADRAIVEVLELLGQGALLDPGAEVVVESAKRNPWTSPEGFALADVRRYGDTVLTRLTREARRATKASESSPGRGEQEEPEP